MKKLVFVVALMAALVSCKKDEESKTTYKVINNSSKYESDMPYLNASMYEVVVFRMKGEEVIGQDNFDKIQYGGDASKVVEVTDDVEKVVVSHKLLPPQSEYYDLDANSRSYTKTRFYLAKGKHTDIIIDDNTMSKGSLSASATPTYLRLNELKMMFK